MNVYATGMNPVDCNALKRAPRVAFFQAFGAMMNVLRENGETLTWRATKVGDGLPPETDAVIVSTMLPRSLNCPYALGAIWTISEALRLDIPLVIYLTDWAFFKANSEFRSIAKAGQPYFSKTIGGALQYNESPEMIAKHGEELLDVCRQWGLHRSKLWRNAQILIPKYTNWGRIGVIQNLLPGANPVLPMDPSPVFVNYLNSAGSQTIRFGMSAREKQWILPSLLNDDTWLNRQSLRWPVVRFGPKGHEVLPTERDIFNVYSISTGALCPPYPTEGSGWWRSRWIHSALAESVLLAGYGDQLEMEDPYLVSGNQYEGMGSDQLEKSARYQKEHLMKILQLDMDVLREQIYAPFRLAGAV